MNLAQVQRVFHHRLKSIGTPLTKTKISKININSLTCL